MNEPTRYTVNTCSLIDLILSSFKDRHVKTEVINGCLSYHYTITGNHNTIKCRSFAYFNEVMFLNDMIKFHSWFDVTKYCDLEAMLQDWKSSFIAVCNKHGPIKSIRIKNKPKPWSDKNVIDLMKERRNHVHNKAVNLESDELFNNYRKLRNDVKCNKEKNVGDAVILLRGKAKNNVISNDISCEDMNNFFATIGDNLNAKIPNKEPLWKGSDFNRKMRLQKRNVLLFINNVPSHPKDQTYPNMKVHFFRANTTSKLQALDQGIKMCLKSH